MNMAIVIDNRPLYQAVAVHEHATAEHRVHHSSTTDDGSFGDNRLNGQAASAILVKGKLGRGQKRRDRTNRPVGIVEVEHGPNVTQVHARVVVGIQRAYIPPVDGLVRRLLCQAIMAKVIGIDGPLTNDIWDDITTEIMASILLARILLQEVNENRRGKQIIT